MGNSSSKLFTALLIVVCAGLVAVAFMAGCQPTTPLKSEFKITCECDCGSKCATQTAQFMPYTEPVVVDPAPVVTNTKVVRHTHTRTVTKTVVVEKPVIVVVPAPKPPCDDKHKPKIEKPKPIDKCKNHDGHKDNNKDCD
jgi:hypothetical protein